jgi:hypothetical protein
MEWWKWVLLIGLESTAIILWVFWAVSVSVKIKEKDKDD